MELRFVAIAIAVLAFAGIVAILIRTFGPKEGSAQWQQVVDAGPVPMLLLLVLLPVGLLSTMVALILSR